MMVAMVPWSRSIPACAGEPAPEGMFTDNATVYPRVCGGTAKRPATMSCRTGLSPRVRGNLRLAEALVANLRSIPACAGEPHKKVALCSR